MINRQGTRNKRDGMVDQFRSEAPEFMIRRLPKTRILFLDGDTLETVESFP